MSTAATLVEALLAAQAAEPHKGYTFLTEQGVPGFSATAQERFFPYADLARLTGEIGGALQALGLKKGERLALILPDNQDFVFCFLGALSAGVIAVPVYPPLGLGKLQAYLDNTQHIVRHSGARMLVTTPAIKRLLGTVLASCPALERILTLEELTAEARPVQPVDLAPSDLAFLQFTSGSTSRPKGVALSHANLIANTRCIMHEGLQVRPDDVGVSWLPLYHDMGLIGFVLAPLVYQVSAVFLPSLLFLKRPSSWLQALTQYRGSISFAPNFAYALCDKRLRESDREGLDLSRWRVAGCGAEPIRAEILTRFAERLAGCGLQRSSLLPCYGMAESSLAVAFSTLGRGVQSVSVQAEPLTSRGQVVCTELPAATDTAPHSALSFVACGGPFPEHQLAIFADTDLTSTEALPDDRVGEIRVRGPSVMRGYWAEQPGRPGAIDAESPENRAAFAGGWLRTGDLGFLHQGQLYVCGRSKEVIIVRGRNYYPQDIEWQASQVPGVRKGNVIAFGLAGATGERVALAFERSSEGGDDQALVVAVRAAVQDGLSLTVDELIALPPGALPKTSSGKLQRARTRELFASGQLTAPKRAPSATEQVLREAARSQWSYLKSAVLKRR